MILLLQLRKLQGICLIFHWSTLRTPLRDVSRAGRLSKGYTFARVRLERSLKSDHVGTLQSGVAFAFNQVGEGWAKLSPMHYSDLQTSRDRCDISDFKPHNLEKNGYCITNVDGRDLFEEPKEEQKVDVLARYAQFQSETPAPESAKDLLFPSHLRTFPEIAVALRYPLHKLMMAEFLKPESFEQVGAFLKTNVTIGHKLFEILTECLGEDSFRNSYLDPLVLVLHSTYLRFNHPFIVDFFHRCIRSSDSGVSSFIRNVTFNLINKSISASASIGDETVESTICTAITNTKLLNFSRTSAWVSYLLQSFLPCIVMSCCAKAEA